jgi:hypothetical protein
MDACRGVVGVRRGSAYERPLDLSDQELIRLWQLAGAIHLDPAIECSSSEAAAIALVAMVEGESRPLARRRRRPQSQRRTFSETTEERQADVHRIEREHNFPHRWD